MNFSRNFFKHVKTRVVYFNRHYSKHPFKRTLDTISNEYKSGFNKNTGYPEHADVVIIGGGFIGSSVAYWLKERAGEGLSVVVIEKDTSYDSCNNIQSHGVISQHYSLPENIFLSQFSADFLRNINTQLKNNVDIQFCPHGTLILASEKYAEKMEQNVEVQKEHGIKNKLLSPDEIRKTYPWINTSDVKLGCLSRETEGIFNAQELLRALIRKSQQLEAKYLNAEVVNFDLEQMQDVLMEGVSPGLYKKINNLVYRTNDNEEYSLKFAVCIVAAGADSANVAKLANIGIDSGLLSIPLPIEKRDFNVYCVENPSQELSIGLNTPITMDTSGLWIRRSGIQNNLICGQIPSLKDDKEVTANEIFQASMNHRYPSFEKSKMITISKEFYDCNIYDDTGIIGPHPYHTNLIFATGFGRQGAFQAPAIGKAVAEIIIDCQYTSIDLTRFGFDRILIDEPLIEHNVY